MQHSQLSRSYRAVLAATPQQESDTAGSDTNGGGAVMIQAGARQPHAGAAEARAGAAMTQASAVTPQQTAELAERTEPSQEELRPDWEILNAVRAALWVDDPGAALFDFITANERWGGDTESLLGVLRVLVEVGNRVGAWQSAVADAIARSRYFRAAVSRDGVSNAGAVDGSVEAISTHTGVSRLAAQRMVERGRYVRRRPFEFAHRFAVGEITPTKMDAVVKVLADVEADTAAVVEDQVATSHEQLSGFGLQRVLQRELIAVDPAQAHHVERRSIAGRRVTSPRPDAIGMARMNVLLPAASALRLHAALNKVADYALEHQDARTRAQLRADALAGWAATVWQYPVQSVFCAPEIGEEEALNTLQPGPEPDPCPAGAGWQRALEFTSTVDGDWDPEVPIDDLMMALAEPGWIPPDPTRARIPAAVTVTVPVDTLAQGAALPGYPHPHGPLEEFRADVYGTLRPDHLADQPDAAPESDALDSAAPESAAPDSAAPACGPSADGGAVPAGAVRRGAVAWLDGFGPVTAATAALLAAGGTWRRLVTDAMGGRPLDLGRTRYHPPQYLKDMVRINQPVCARPGCDRPASECEIDHVHEWHLGGATSLENLQPLCKRCHQLKTAGLLHARARPDGSTYWYLSAQPHQRE